MSENTHRAALGRRYTLSLTFVVLSIKTTVYSSFFSSFIGLLEALAVFGCLGIGPSFECLSEAGFFHFAEQLSSLL